MPVMLDGAHVLGQQRVDLRRLEAAGVDYWISDAHKWLFSPKGSAVLWVTREKQNRLMPSALGAVVRSAASMVRPPINSLLCHRPTRVPSNLKLKGEPLARVTALTRCKIEQQTTDRGRYIKRTYTEPDQRPPCLGRPQAGPRRSQ